MDGYHMIFTVVYNFRLTVVKKTTKKTTLVQLITIRDTASGLFDKMKQNAMLME